MKYDESYWRDKKPVSLASVQGFSPMIQLPELIYEAYPEMRKWVFGVFDEYSYSARYADGWAPMFSEDFPDYQSFTTAIGSRFGLQVHADGRLMIAGQFLMKMPKAYRKDYEAAVHAASEKHFSELVHSSPHIADGLQSEATYEEKKFVPQSAAPTEIPRKRGRPRKEK